MTGSVPINLVYTLGNMYLLFCILERADCNTEYPAANEYTHIEYIATSIFIITPANRSGIFPDFSYLPRAGD